jgi:hypothetical protein
VLTRVSVVAFVLAVVAETDHVPVAETDKGPASFSVSATLTQDPNPAATEFVAALKRNVAKDDRKAVAAMIRYPILINTGAVRIPFADAGALVEGYQLVFSPELKSAIAQSGFVPPGQPSSKYQVLVSDRLMTLAGGYIGAEKFDGVFRITRMSLPDSGTGSGAPLAPPTGGASRGGSARSPQRLTLQGRQRIAQERGTVSAGETQSYVVWAGQGQMLEARIDGVRGREVLLKIVNAKTGTPIDARASEGLRRWSGRIATGADYRIDVVRGDSSAAAPDYLLVVTVK